MVTFTVRIYGLLLLLILSFPSISLANQELFSTPFFAPIPQQGHYVPMEEVLTAFPDPLGKIHPSAFLDSRSASFFVPYRSLKLSSLAGGLWLRFVLNGNAVHGKHLFLNLGSAVATPVQVFRVNNTAQEAKLEELGSYGKTRIHLQTSELATNATYTYYVHIANIPSPFFAPILENRYTSLGNAVDTFHTVFIAFLFVLVLFSLVRAVLQRRILFFTNIIYLIALLTLYVVGTPSTYHGFLENPFYSVALIIVVFCYPLLIQYFLSKQGQCPPKNITRFYILCTTVFSIFVLLPQIPTLTWLTRFYALWPLFFVVLLPPLFIAVRMQYTNAILFSLATLIPVVTYIYTWYCAAFTNNPFFYVEILPLMSIAIQALCISLLSAPFVFSYTSQESEHINQSALDEIIPQWMQQIATNENTEFESPEEDSLTEETFLETQTEESHYISQENSPNPSLSTMGQKERIVNALQKAPRITTYSPRELFIYLYRALKIYAESYNVELSWFVDPDLTEDQEHDSDVIYSTLYSIGESLIVNNPNSSVHISAKNITDPSFPAHIRFSIMITPEETLNHFNSNSVSQITELIALAGGTLFMGNAQGKRLEMIITLPAVARPLFDTELLNQHTHNTALPPSGAIEQENQTTEQNSLQAIEAEKESLQALLKQDTLDPTEDINDTNTIPALNQSETLILGDEELQDITENLPFPDKYFPNIEDSTPLSDIIAEETTPFEEQISVQTNDISSLPVEQDHITAYSDMLTYIDNIIQNTEDFQEHELQNAPEVQSNFTQDDYVPTPTELSFQEENSSESLLEATPLEDASSYHSEESSLPTEYEQVPTSVNTTIEDTPLEDASSYHSEESSLPTEYEQVHTSGNATTEDTPLEDASSYHSEESSLPAEYEQVPTSVNATIEDTPLEDASSYHSEESSLPAEYTQEHTLQQAFIENDSPTQAPQESASTLPPIVETSSTRFTESIRSSMQELIEAQNIAELEDIEPVFSDKASIIIFDPNPSDRRLLLYFLEDLPYALSDVDSTQALLNQHRHYPAHLVVLDTTSIEIPLEDIIRQLHIIDSKYNQPPVIIIALTDSPVYFEELKNAGAVTALVKPVHHDEFRELIQKLLPPKAYEKQRTARQWQQSGMLKPKDLSKVSITLGTEPPQSTQQTTVAYKENPQNTNTRYSTVPTNSFTTTPYATQEAPEISVVQEDEPALLSEQLMEESSLLEKDLKTIEAEIYALPKTQYAEIPHFLNLLQMLMKEAEMAMRAKKLFQITEITQKIAQENVQFQLPTLAKVSLCIMRAAEVEDEQAVTQLFSELAEIMEKAIALLIQLYNEQ